MTKILRLSLLAALALAPKYARAQTPAPITYTWSAPTSYSDGKALPAGDVWFYTFTVFGATTEGWMPFNQIQLDPATLTYTVQPICGAYTAYVSVTTTITATEPFTTSAPAGPITIDTGVKCPVFLGFFLEGLTVQ